MTPFRDAMDPADWLDMDLSYNPASKSPKSYTWDLFLWHHLTRMCLLMMAIIQDEL
jgi:hypothetical protein